MQKYKKYLSDKAYLTSLGLSLLFISVSLVINFYAGTYATEKASNSVTDIVLDNIPVYDVDILFVWGPVAMWAFVAWLGIKNPNIIPFILKNVALFVLVRSMFISLTHLGPFPDQIALPTGNPMINGFTFGADLFFSGHTGLPFLLALIFHEQKPLKIFFIVSAIFFGGVVLLAHRHYTIDVLSAFFITYTIYHIGLRIFKKDLELFNEEPSV